MPVSSVQRCMYEPKDYFVPLSGLVAKFIPDNICCSLFTCHYDVKRSEFGSLSNVLYPLVHPTLLIETSNINERLHNVCLTCCAIIDSARTTLTSSAEVMNCKPPTESPDLCALANVYGPVLVRDSLFLIVNTIS